MRFRPAGIVVLALLSACATSMPRSSTPPGEADPRYAANATVLQPAGKSPMLCVGAVGASYPPQCEGPPITNWDWSEAHGERSAAGTTWGVYRVVGTFDGEKFTLTEPPGPQRQATEAPDAFDTPCEAPAGGWTVRDPKRATDEARTAAIQHAHRSPDLAGVWVDDPSKEAGPAAGVVLNISFTGDLERHEAELEKIWGGALCVSKAARSLKQLRTIQEELTGPAARDLGVDVLSVGIHDPDNAVDLRVVLVRHDTKQRLDARYSDGVVRVTGALVPVA